MDGYIGEIRMMAFNFQPMYWALCNGQQLSIPQNNVLYSVIGVTYGGDGRNYFNLPDLRGFAPVGIGTATGGNIVWQLGEPDEDAATSVTLLTANAPPHTHIVTAETVPPANFGTNMSATPSNAAFLSRGLKLEPNVQPATYEVIPMYNATLERAGRLPSQTIGVACGNTTTLAADPHENRQPFLGMNFFICTEGEYPPLPQ